jgi:hypothetical protein
LLDEASNDLPDRVGAEYCVAVGQGAFRCSLMSLSDRLDFTPGGGVGPLKAALRSQVVVADRGSGGSVLVVVVDVVDDELL